MIRRQTIVPRKSGMKIRRSEKDFGDPMQRFQSPEVDRGDLGMLGRLAV